MSISWSQGNLSYTEIDGILSIDLNKCRFGIELRPEITEVLKEYTHFLIAGKATDRHLMLLAETFENTEKK